MTSLAIAIIFAGMLYILTPGPLFLSLITLIQEGTRSAVLRFLGGALFGISILLTVVIAPLIEASASPLLFLNALGFFGGLYMLSLSYKLFVKTKKQEPAKVFSRPITEGIALILLNPRGYTLMFSTLSAAVMSHGATLAWAHFAFVFVFAIIGVVLAFTILITLFSSPVFTLVYTRFSNSISYALSMLYLIFGGTLIYTSLIDIDPDT